METITEELAAALTKVERPGDFYTSGVQETLAPTLEVDGPGRIALPLLPVQAEQLIAIAERAPFGKGEATVTDTSVRRTWQIAPGRVHIGGRHWSETFLKIVERAAEGLGVTERIEAELYKLLIYDEGSFFVPHRDTEKTKGMFATLILILPSLSEGGELVVRHNDREARLDMKCEEASDIAFAAFYADCVHEVRPVTNGYRLALIYNLVRPGRGALPKAPDYAAQETNVAKILRIWADELKTPGSGEPDKVVYPLEHAYTPAELSFQALKGADAGIARVLAAAAPHAACELHLALITIDEQGSAEHTGHARPRRGRSRYDDDDDDEFEVGEIFDRTVLLSDWCRPDGEASPLTNIPVEDAELSPPEIFEDMEPDELHFHEATGNEGASFERTYRRAALVLWPESRLFAVINQAGLSVTLPYLSDLHGRWVSEGADPDSPLWHQAHELSGHMIGTFPTEYWRPSSGQSASQTAEMLNLLRGFRDLPRLDAMLSVIAARGGFDREDSEAAAHAIRVFPPDQARLVLERTFLASVEKSLAACAAALAQLATLGPACVAGAAAIVVRALPAAPPRDVWYVKPHSDPRLPADLFAALSRIDPALGDQAAGFMLARPAVYDLDGVLVPAVRAMRGSGLKSTAIETLRRACAAHLEARIALPLEAPRDWGRPSAVGCDCPHCKDLSRFLADPASPRWVLKAAEATRRHVAQTVQTAKCDVDLFTERKGSPHGLICTKNQASYERRKKHRAGDVVDLEELNA